MYRKSLKTFYYLSSENYVPRLMTTYQKGHLAQIYIFLHSHHPLVESARRHHYKTRCKNYFVIEKESIIDNQFIRFYYV